MLQLICSSTNPKATCDSKLHNEWVVDLSDRVQGHEPGSRDQRTPNTWPPIDTPGRACPTPQRVAQTKYTKPSHKLRQWEWLFFRLPLFEQLLLWASEPSEAQFLWSYGLTSCGLNLTYLFNFLVKSHPKQPKQFPRSKICFPLAKRP